MAPVHLVKLCVGAGTLDELQQWIRRRVEDKARRGEPAEHVHTTRMTPKRRTELLDGGSLYWVIRGVIQCRQRLLDLDPFIDDAGIGRCRIVLEPRLVPVSPRPRGPFQGWRYLDPADAPSDLPDAGGDGNDMPVEMRRELAALGLL